MFVPHGHKQPAVLCILSAGDSLLLLHRNKEPNEGKYTPVGGKIDPFESPYDAALRETREETGIEISDARYCGVLVESSPTKYNWICFVYLADVEQQEPAECDEGTLEWVEIDRLPAIPTPETDKHIYRHVVDRKPFMFDAKYDGELNLLQMTEEIAGKEVYSWSHLEE
jgi:8-oxo-dGTP diphosphatase